MLAESGVGGQAGGTDVPGGVGGGKVSWHTKAPCTGPGKSGALQGSRIGYSRRAFLNQEEWKPKTGILKEL